MNVLQHRYYLWLQNIAFYPFIAIGYIVRWLINGAFFRMFGLTGLQVISRLIYFPGVTWNTVSWRWRNYQWYNRIDNTVVLGALPFRSQTEEVRKYWYGHKIYNHL